MPSLLDLRAKKPPITYVEMQTLLEPLQNSLQRLEHTVQELSTSSEQRQQQQQQPLSPKSVSPTSVCRERSKSSSVTSKTPDQDDSGANGTHGLNRTVLAAVEGSLENNHNIFERLQINRDLKAEGLAEGHAVRPALFDKVLLKLSNLAHRWSNLREPERNTCFSRVILSRYFEALCLSLIILNSACVACTADWQIRHIGSDAPIFLDVAERCFFVWFTFELIVRLLVHRLYFFLNPDMLWNIFDFILVSISVIQFMVSLIAEAKGDSNVSFMRLLRLLKLAKIFRSLRAFRFVKSLEQMLESLTRSFISLFWGFVMLAFILYLFSLIFMQAMIDYLISVESDSLIWLESMNKFGSLGSTILSLYMAVTGGDDWGVLYEIIAPTGWVYGLLLVFFTFFFIFALFNILTGCLIEKAMAACEPERTERIMMHRKRLADERHTFEQLCHSMDKDGDGLISWSEFQQWISDPIMFAYLSSIGIQIYDVELFFRMVGNRESMNGETVSKGAITIPYFVEACMHMRGSATAMDMQRQLFEMHILHHDVRYLDASVNKRFQHLEQLISSNLQLGVVQ